LLCALLSSPATCSGRRYGYQGGFATVTVAAGGVVDLLTPLDHHRGLRDLDRAEQQNIAKLFQAALIPAAARCQKEPGRCLVT
jgi:C4-dicarboxylate transporter, DctM subunit